MILLRNLLLIALAVSAISLADAQEKQTANKDLASLQGEWVMVSGTADGYPIPKEWLSNSKRICKGNELTATVNGQLVMKAKITIDASKNPKTIDYDVIEGPTKGKKHLGIYELDGDTLKSCFGAPGAERPTEFTSKEGDHRTSTVWKQAKVATAAEK